MSPDLVVSGLTVRYGGNVAVDDVSFTAAGAGITGLIGPNGAGKTTTFNACSGLLRPSDGTISFGARDITALPVYRRSQLGLGRTFQRMELFESLSVRDNVALGREAGLAGSHPLSHLWSSRRARSEVAQATDDAIAVCDIDELADVPVSALSTGQRRLVELARAVAGRSTLLLLDEPSSGLDHAETDRFGDILMRLVDERGVGLLLVEHDMSLVMRVCAHIYVLEFGRLLFDGSAADVRASDVVREAYLGSAA